MKISIHLLLVGLALPALSQNKDSIPPKEAANTTMKPLKYIALIHTSFLKSLN